MRAAYRVEGLDCGEEVAVLKKEVGAFPGVTSLNFDVVHAKMVVDFDPDQVDSTRIEEAVAAAGMKAVPWDQRFAEEESATFRARHGRLIMVCISVTALAAGLFSHWRLHGDILDALGVGYTMPGHVFPPVSIAFYVIAAVAGAWYVLPKAWAAFLRLRPDMNLLMTVAIIGAMCIGEWFEAGTVAMLFAVANLLEHWSVGRARRAISALVNMRPTVARLIDPERGGIVERSIENVPVGAIVIVRPGEKIPLDGIITKGRTSVNQAPITGESMPVDKEPGDEVFAGSINGEGAIEFRVTKPAEDTTLARIIHLVQEAQSRRAPAEQWVEQFARYYTPAMMILASLIAIVPPLLLGGDWAEYIYKGLVILVIACPCALVISTPVSVVAALTSAARNGVLIKGGVHLEGIGKIHVLALDKTGTLTHGMPEVQRVIPMNGHTVEELLERAAALEANSEHPLARAILRYAEEHGVTMRKEVEDFRALTGKGAEARIDGRPFWIGNLRMAREKGAATDALLEEAARSEDAGHSVVVIGNDRHVCGLISVGDAPREEAAYAVEQLKRLGIRHIAMLTGDNERAARALAVRVGVNDVYAELLPEDKVRIVEELKQRYGRTAMVGDGVNDAPAMAAADTALAMAAMGTDVAVETADIALMTDDLGRVPWLVRHSRRALRTIKQNIVFALGLKFAFIVLAVAGVASLWMAIAADTGASLLVIFNALRLLRT